MKKETDLLQLVQKDFQLTPADSKKTARTNLLRAYLIEVINDLLDRDFDRLLQAMYRIDISEVDFQKALNTSNPSHVAQKIADLVIERELQKVNTRNKYA